MNFKKLAAVAWKKFDMLLEQQKALLNGNPTGLTEEQAKEFDGLQTQMDAAEKEAQRYEALVNSEEKMNGSVSVPIQFPASHEKQENMKDDGGFDSLWEFVKALRFGDDKGRLSQKDMVGTDDNGKDPGGFLLPPRYSDQILALDAEGQFVRNYATTFPSSPERPDTSVVIPAMDYNVNNYGGVTVDWVEEEGGEKPETTMKMTTVSLTPHEIAAWIPVSDKLLRNSRASETIIRRNMLEALLNAEQQQFLHGDGKGKPLGVLTSGNAGAVTVTVATAGTLTYADILKMRTKMPQESYRKAVWVIDQTYMADVLNMTDAAGRLIYLPGNITSGGADTLLGRPIIWNNANTGVGLIDFSAYLIQDGFGVYIGASEHVRYTKNQTVIKIFRYVDGKPWVTQPLKYSNKLSLSPYVLLDGTITA